MLSLELADARQQEHLGALIAAEAEKTCIIYLEGELGAGKTTLVRGFLRGLGYQGNVKSPTFTLLEPYILEHRSVFHLDLYRLADPEELDYLGLRDLLEKDAALLIEWPDRGGGQLPAADLVVTIEYQGEGRSLDLQPISQAGDRLIEALNNRLQHEVNKLSHKAGLS
ncbi:MAG: tRNA (adenosine(37)-N6)-threonylcarbamoyltransferase complex ATPase subunit type 1 TsaE [Gammaproteobacteria bacterium]|nr:tRNA (adenosine(37)-N6)-threonylcarbamoyltransferase complex ATPase subunit type 1 TsaE [Gammaproteobacteria bacterium]